MKDLYIFVEGPIDKLFIEKVFLEKLDSLWENCIIIEYAKMNKKKIKSFIVSIKQMDNSEYMFLSDQDGRKDKKEKLLESMPFLDKEKVFLSIFEIESWIFAGVSANIVKKYNIKLLKCSSSEVTKETFEKIIPKNLDKIGFISVIFDEYNIVKAIKENNSLKEFFDYFCNKKAS